MDHAQVATLARHPLDPLETAEIAAIRALLDAEPRCTTTMRVTTLELREPAKANVLPWASPVPVT